MALIDTKEQGNLATSGLSIDEKIATRYFIVRFSTLVLPNAAEAATGVPAYGGILPGDETIPDGLGGTITNPYPRRVKTLTVRAWEQDTAIFGTIWQVQVDYSDKANLLSDPLTVPPEISWDFSDATQTYFIDNSSTPKPTINSAGQPFEKLLERETGTIVATVKRNLASFDVSQAVTYCGDGQNGKAVNSDAFTVDGVSIAVGQAIISGMQASGWKVSNGVKYREVTHVLKLRSSWDDKIADVGFNELDGSGKLVPIQPNTGSTSSPPRNTDKPWPLDGSGHKKTNAADTPATLTFKPYKALPFAVFSFA